MIAGVQEDQNAAQSSLDGSMVPADVLGLS